MPEKPREAEDEAADPAENAAEDKLDNIDTETVEEGEDDLDNDLLPGEDVAAENKPDIDAEPSKPYDAEGNDELGNDFSPEEEAHDGPDDEETSPGECNSGEDTPEDDDCVPESDRETGDSGGDQEENPDEAPDGSSDVETQDDPGALDESGGSESSGETESGEEVSIGESIPSGNDVEENDESEPDNTEEESPEEELLTGMDELIGESEAETRSFRDEPPEKHTPEYSREEVEEAARTGVMKSRLVVQVLPPDPERRAYYERILKPLAHKAAEEVRKILEGRHSIIRRNLRKGALDPSALWKVPVKEPDIFMKRDIPGQKVDLAVYLLIDCSGSMSIGAKGRWSDCGCRMDYAACSAILLHLMCRELGIPHAATGFTTQYVGSYRENVLHLTVKKFSEHDGCFDGLFSYEFRNMMSNNVDGYSIRAAAKELSIRPEKQKVLFVISDGRPEAYGYYGPPAFKDTALAVRETERSGIGVIGVYIGESDSTVKLLYPNLIMLNAGDLPVVLARTLRKVITGPA